MSARPALPELGDDDVPATRKAEHIPATPAAGAADPPAVHVVHRGDTLFDLAHRYHVQIAQLKRWNHLRGNAIRIGQKLRVRAPE